MHTLPIQPSTLLPARAGRRDHRDTDRKVAGRAAVLLSDFFPGLALAVLLFTLLALTGAGSMLPVAAGTAAFLYLGTAVLSGSLVTAGVDLAAAAGAALLAATAGDAQTVAAAWLVHALWGTARSTLAGSARRRLTNWSALAGGLAILVLVG